MRCLLPLLPLLLLLLLLPALAGAAETIHIGVLSHRGSEITLRTWSATADYLSEQLPDYRFSVVPLDFHEVEAAVAAAEVDFVLVNPGIYVSLEVGHRVSRIATLNNRHGGVPFNLFGGVLFTRADRADRADVAELADLKGKRLVAVDETSLGGFLMAWGEIARAGIDPWRDLDSVTFAGTHDEVVKAVRDGRADVGTVRTDILEVMAAAGEIQLTDLRVINSRSRPDFPFAHSTRLYPEWPFSKVRHTPNHLAQQVAVALLNMPPDHPAAVAGQYAGWTIPLDYQPVHELLKELNLPPYQAHIRPLDVLRAYWPWLLVGLLALLLLVALSAWGVVLNRRLQRANLMLERQHNLILDSVAEGVYGVDLNGNCTFVNRAMERITGWKAQEFTGRPQHEVMHHTRSDGTPHTPDQCPVYATCRDGRPRFVEDDMFWRKDGSRFPVEYSTNPIEDARGNIVGVVVVFRDMTERRQAEERMRQHQLELAHVARLTNMGEMASGLAHEINQPLAAIANYTRGCVRLLKAGDAQPGQLLEVMERVAVQAERAGEIIRQMRAFIRKDQSAVQEVDLNLAVRELFGFVGPELRRAEVALVLDLDERVPRVLGQPIQIEQVLLNLVRNAIEAMEEGTRERCLRVSSRVIGGVAEVAVADTGPGLDGELMQKLFEPFVTTKAQGMGLGLSISRGIIEAHGGRMVVESRSGEGAVFRFTLPLHENQDENAA